MSTALHTLISGLPPFEASDWTDLADKALGGANFDETLVRQTADGIKRGPVFFKAPRDGHLGQDDRDLHLPWQIRQVFSESSLQAANAAILADLIGGVSEIGLQIDRRGQYGLAAYSTQDFETVFQQVDLGIAPAFLEPGHDIDAAAFAEWAVEHGAKTGGLGLRADDSSLADIASTFPSWRVVSIDARCVHETGGSEAQELAYAAAGYAEAIGRLIEGGIGIDQARQQIEVTIAVDTDIHLSLSKIRAAHLVLGQTLEAYSATIQTALIRCISSQRVLTRTDAWTNIIRLSAIGFAAGCSGAQSITLYPPTQALGRPDRMARRIARNLHILLQEESRIGGVTDPAAGSYLHETLSQEIAAQAWMMFQSIEVDGGFAALSTSSGFVRAVSEKRERLMDAYRTGQSTLFGINKYAAPALRDMRFEPGDAPPSSDELFPTIRLEDAALEGVSS